ncbi:MAG: hypothetical protein J2P17_17070 [Mycobacterium sp.]|nr:hypothetical protein [Mycobacterium sp.]
MTNCEVCSRRAQLYLCDTCRSALGEMLTNLADGLRLDLPATAPPEREGHNSRSRPLLQCLQDAALGQTRLGVSARHSTDHTTPLPHNPNASQLLDDATTTLTKWVTAINLTHQTLAINDKDTTE